MEKHHSAGRNIYRPLEKLDKCAYCQTTGTQAVKLRLCTSCGEIAYCSPECQKKDWKAHKLQCGTTDRVDIQSFYPLLAAIIQISHMHPDNHHPALNHKIINSPGPKSGDIVKLPNGVAAKIVLLGENTSLMAVGSEEWWPGGATPMIRHKLMRRIMAEGLLLPILMATTISLISEMYTTTAVPASESPDWQVTARRRVRLTYNRSPIADFGIVQGSVRVTPQDRLAYYSVDEPGFLMGQDPNDHYWIYFTTLSGEELFLDCGMFTFNFCLMADVDAYCRYGLPEMGYSPAYWFGRELAKVFPATVRDKIGWKPRKKFSILRENRLDNILRSTEIRHHDIPVLHDLMDEIACRSCTDWEKEMMMKFLPNAITILRLNMRNRSYLSFPKEPTLIVDQDPGESTSTEDGKEEQALSAYLGKLARKLKKRKITPAQWESAFDAWNNKPHEARLKMAGLAK